MSESCDCVVVGAGPAGCTAAALVAEAGYRTVLLERQKLPRFHVGESLMPETYWTLQRLGVLDQLRRSAFPPKVGVQFVSSRGRESQPFFFDEDDPRDCSRTWHVERADFDWMLYQNAGRKGARCRDQARVTDIALPEATGGQEQHGSTVTYQMDDGERRQLSTRVVVDATGQHAILANRLGLRIDNPRLRKASIWTYYRGAQRSPDPARNTTVILHTQDKAAWFWYIPLSNDVVSVGVVGDKDYLLKGRGTPEQTFAEELRKCAGMQPRLENASRCGDIHVAREFSYTTRQQAGPGWVLVGDAFGFIDPVYSSGVFLALRSGELAADAIVDGLKKNDVSAAQLGRWTPDFQSGVERVRKLVHAFYTNEFSFAEFMKQHPQHRKNLTDLLIGRVFEDESERIFVDLEPRLAAARQSAIPVSS
jgi:flavin-dependent dehydrogenase